MEMQNESHRLHERDTGESRRLGRRERDETPDEQDSGGASWGNGISGLGGWLILVQITLWLSLLGSVLYIANGLIPLLGKGVLGEMTAPGKDRMWARVIIFEAAGNVVLTVLIAAALVLLYRKKRSFPRLMLVYYGAVLALNIAGYALLHSIDGISDSGLTGPTSKLIRNVASCSIWISYFIRSERVRSTFRR
jgi:hypothetical protein